jgi:hypothetical protein
MNVVQEQGCEILFLGIFVSNFRYSVFGVSFNLRIILQFLENIYTIPRSHYYLQRFVFFYSIDRLN